MLHYINFLREVVLSEKRFIYRWNSFIGVTGCWLGPGEQRERIADRKIKKKRTLVGDFDGVGADGAMERQ